MTGTEVFFAARVDITSTGLRCSPPDDSVVLDSSVTQNSATLCPQVADKGSEFADARSLGESESRRRVTPASDGRAVRATATEDAVLLDILSTRGNSMEGVWLDRAQLLGLIGILREAQREADDLADKHALQEKVESDHRYREALSRNPWLNGTNDKLRDERYIRRER